MSQQALAFQQTEEVDLDLAHPYRLAVKVTPAAMSGKRLFDIVVGTVLAVVTIPVQLLVLGLSALSFRAWPIFSQTRVGYNGEPFTFRKVRSLPVTAPSEAPKGDLAEVNNTFVGRMLRKTHLDETVQFWSVISGKLTLVGPRPEMVGLSDSYDRTFVANRTSVRPGLTGLWQISDGCYGLIGESPEYDVYYVLNRSWRLDLWIMVRTVSKMANSSTVSMADLPK